MKIMKIVTTKELREVCRRSDKAKLSSLPSDQLWKEIDPHGQHVLNPMPIPVESRFVRSFAMCKMKDKSDPAEVWIDVIADDWMRLAEAGATCH